jgi:hypothetical protein
MSVEGATTASPTYTAIAMLVSSISIFFLDSSSLPVVQAASSRPEIIKPRTLEMVHITELSFSFFFIQKNGYYRLWQKLINPKKTTTTTRWPITLRKLLWKMWM